MKLFFISLILVVSGCGLKVVDPEVEKNKGTKALDFSSGSIKIVDTYTCSIVAGNGQRVSSVAKSESEAKSDALIKCRSQTLISICRPENLKCFKN